MKKHLGYYSETGAKLFGTVIWKDWVGVEYEVTSVSETGDAHGTYFPDQKLISKFLVEFVRRGRIGELEP